MREANEDMQFFRDHWKLVLYWSVTKGLIYGIQVAIIVSMAKCAWRG
jgi:hypothetical protein